MRQLNFLDHAIHSFDQALRSIVPNATQAQRDNPAQSHQSHLTTDQSRHVAGLMRVNHTGEVCAQALYHGQALAAKSSTVRESMQQAAQEEQDHLAWCEQRLKELDSHTSLLNPLWYGLSFTLGAAAGWAGDKYSLGFVAETERQVSQHLEDHLAQLPQQDQRSKAILAQMNEEELHHRDTALNAGAVSFPKPVQLAMQAMSKVMTKTSYYL